MLGGTASKPVIAIVFFISAMAAIALGVVIAWQWENGAPAKTDSKIAAPAIEHIVLGAIPAEQKDTPRAGVTPRQEYTTADWIGLRVVAEPAGKAEYSYHVRLLDARRQEVALKPDTVSLPGGDARFCCWQVAQPGQYVLQVFRPDGVITPFSFSVKPGASPGRL